MSPNPSTEPIPATVSPGAPGDDHDSKPLRQRLLHPLRFSNISAIYVWVLIIALFSFLAPDTFPTMTTVKAVLNQNAIGGIVALSIIVPLCTETFDLSVGNVVAMSGVLCAYLLVHGTPMAVALALAISVGVAAGIVNSILVVGVGIWSFIATLATGSLLAAAVGIMSNNGISITGSQLTTGFFAELANSSFGGFTVPVFLMLGVAAVLWILLDHSATGRRLYATGFNETAARLVGIHTNRLRVGALLCSGVVAALAGIMLASQLSSGEPDVGPSFLLDSFAAAFVGATQFRAGRFNAWGTVVAVLLLGTGRSGLVLIGAEPWAGDMFTGVVLIAALALTKMERTAVISQWMRRRRSEPRVADGPADSSPPDGDDPAGGKTERGTDWS